MSGLETIYYIFTKPAIAIRDFDQTRPVGWAFFIVLLATISTSVGGVLISTATPTTAKIILSLGLLARIIFIIGVWIIATAIIHLFAEWLDGDGKASNLFIALGFSFLPAILITPFALLIQNCSSTIKFLLYLCFNLIILLWVVRLEIISIKEVYHVSSFRAMMMLSTPITLGILGIISLIIISLLISFLLISPSFHHLPLHIFP
jgi:hypothetical protein